MRVAVILSSYNGERYLRQQIDSILNQENVVFELFIRDDGSQDATVAILREYERAYDNIHVTEGENIGFRSSFMQELLAHEGFDFYAFSDQDDFWEKEKLIAACSMIIKENSPFTPTVYYSNLDIADECLNVYKRTALERRKHSLESVIMRRSIAGCTMVFNKAMWERIAKNTINEHMLRRGHDSFIISLCYSLGGIVICDRDAYIHYRQHSDNTSGGMHGPKQRVIKEWKALTQKKGQESEMALSILNAWQDDITNEAEETLRTVSSIGNNIFSRFRIFFSPKYCTGDLKLTVLGKIKALVGLL